MHDVVARVSLLAMQTPALRSSLGGTHLGALPDAATEAFVDAFPSTPFTGTQLAQQGMTRAMLRRHLARGTLRRVLRGVYVRADREDSPELRAAAAALVVPPGHVLVDRTAAWLHGIEVFSLDELEAGVAVETCALRGRNPTCRSGTDGRTRDLSADDIMVLDGIRVTTPLRTALDLGCHLRRREAYAALCLFARHHDVSRSQLLDEVQRRYRRRRGVVQLRELVAVVDHRFESPREAWAFLAIHDASIPPPEPQVWVEGPDGRYRLDLAYVRRRVCVEYDGEEFHDRTPEQRRADAERRAWLRAHGWTVIVVARGDFTGSALDDWLRALRQALADPYSTRRW